MQLFRLSYRIILCLFLVVFLFGKPHTLYSNSIIYGDINNDGVVAIDDALILLRYNIGFLQLSDDQLARGDVNKDGNVDISDSLIILRYLTGVVTSLPLVSDSNDDGILDPDPIVPKPDPDVTVPVYNPDHRVKGDGYLYGLDYWKNEVRITKAPTNLIAGDYQVKDDFTFYLISGNELVDKGKFYYLNDVPYAIMNLDIRADAKVTSAYLQDFSANRNASSPFKNLGEAFMEAQEIWGVNALYLMAHAALESAWGTSKIAQDKNNLFGFKAYDSDPYNYAGTFRNMDECILYVGGYIRRAYLSEDGRWFNGPSLEGMNNYYATDPMWKIKIARVMGSIMDHTEYKAVNKILQRGKVVNVSSASHLNLRSGPGISHGVVGTLSGGTSVDIKGMKVVNSCNWFKLKTTVGEGWVCGSFIELLTVPQGAIFINDWYLIDKEPPEVNVRCGPGTEYNVVDKLSFAKLVDVHEIKMSGKDAWYRISYPGSTEESWINGSFILVKW